MSLDRIPARASNFRALTASVTEPTVKTEVFKSETPSFGCKDEEKSTLFTVYGEEKKRCPSGKCNRRKERKKDKSERLHKNPLNPEKMRKKTGQTVQNVIYLFII